MKLLSREPTEADIGNGATPFAVCMAWDAFRVCLGQAPQNYPVSEIVRWMELLRRDPSMWDAAPSQPAPIDWEAPHRAYVLAHTVKSNLPVGEGDNYRHGWYDACLEVMKMLVNEWPEAALPTAGKERT